MPKYDPSDYDDSSWWPNVESSEPYTEIRAGGSDEEAQMMLWDECQDDPVPELTAASNRDIAAKSNGTLPLTLGGVTYEITGGPYYHKPEHALGIKLAVEIDEDCHVDLPIKDFNVPTQAAMEIGVIESLQLLFGSKGQEVYAGCMGGIGRTGLLFACLVKVEQELNLKWYSPLLRLRFWRKSLSPVEYVRCEYYPHAVETQQQQDFVSSFDAKAVAKFVKRYLTN